MKVQFTKKLSRKSKSVFNKRETAGEPLKANRQSIVFLKGVLPQISRLQFPTAMTIELVSRIANLSPNVTEAHLHELLSMDSLGRRAVRIKKVIMPKPVAWQTCPHGRAEVVGATEEDTIKVYGVLHGAVIDGGRVNVSFAKVDHALPPSERPVVKGRTTEPPARLRKIHDRPRRSRSWSVSSRSSSLRSDSSGSSGYHRRRRRRSDRYATGSRSISSSSRSYRRRKSRDPRRTRHSSRHTSSTSSSSFRSSSRSSSRSVRRRRTRSGSSTRGGKREHKVSRQRTPPSKSQRRASKYN